MRSLTQTSHATGTGQQQPIDDLLTQSYHAQICFLVSVQTNTRTKDDQELWRYG